MNMSAKCFFISALFAIACGAWWLNVRLKRVLPVIPADANKTETRPSPLDWSEAKKQEAINQAKAGDRKNIDALIDAIIDSSADQLNSTLPHEYSANAKLLEPPYIKKHHLDTKDDFDQAIDQAGKGDKDYMYGLLIWYSKRGDLENARKWEKKINEMDSEKEGQRQDKARVSE